MMFNATFNNISVISWRLVLLVRETVVPGENHWPIASHWQILSDNVVLSTPRHKRDSNSAQNKKSESITLFLKLHYMLHRRLLIVLLIYVHVYWYLINGQNLWIIYKSTDSISLLTLLITKRYFYKTMTNIN